MHSHVVLEGIGLWLHFLLEIVVCKLGSWNPRFVGTGIADLTFHRMDELLYPPEV